MGGTVLAVGSVLLGANACALSGASRLLSEVDPPRLLEAQALAGTVGAVLCAVLAVLSGRSGRGSIANLGALLLPAAIVVGVAGLLHIARGEVHLMDAVPLCSLSLVLVIASMVAMSRGPDAPPIRGKALQ
jgi:hypothetical protein